jgi:DNA-binding NarL/FixJ family response regulator
MPRLRILLADDHGVVREGLKALINSQETMDVVGEAEDGRTACDLALALEPDVVVMDLSMPGMNGIEATRELHRRSPAVRILALTAREDASVVRETLAAGASGYVLKHSVAQALVDAIHVVARGEVYVDPVVAASLALQFAHKARGGPAAAMAELSPRETEVLQLIAHGHSNKEIATRLDVSVKTVETHKARSMAKLGLTGRADIVRLAVEQGWLQTLTTI